ncbi:putative lipid-binding transport protein (Tim44 family) [Amaricoccus macauensis]|uniref:Putative lipid-binding transport protein (Tim44 family) n=1 Tax=Amaricoccus macauensis TaxID=57001 RepID=A0A840SLV0_9RHOB|nr:Tim44/TimA family putative adaptor protein [Amaricoccus macauensis]MBB5221585.1 putative lipid-binding transport protein (Tim44 family) [Amaricoccus macauensis]
MGSQMIQIIILAAIALFLILRLRNVLGTREGFEKPQETSTPVPQRRSPRPFDVIDGGTVDPDIADVIDPTSPSGQALIEMKRVDRTFSVSDFSHGARSAYEMIVMAYENGDLETLRRFLSPEVFGPFEAAIAQRNAKGYTVEATFAGVREVKLVDAHYDAISHEGDITMRFTGELTSVVRDPEGRIVEGAPGELKQQRDVWTFSRDMTSENPNWQLTGTGG